METFRKRAATLLSVGRSRVDSTATGDRTSSQSPQREKSGIEEACNTQGPGTPGNGTDDDSQSTVIAGNEEPISGFSHGVVRVLPPWVNATEDDEDEDDPNPSSQLLPEEPSLAHAAHHNHTPTVLNPPGFLSRHKHEPGRRFDNRRGSEPPTPRHHPREIASRWRQFAEDSEYPRNENEHRQLVDEEYLIEHGPHFTNSSEDEHQEKTLARWQSKRRTRLEKARRTVLRSAIIPLIFRTIVFAFCLMALGLGGSIYHNLGADYPIHTIPACQRNYDASGTSPLMAIIVDCLAILYLFYITYDEYRGLPLGLRSGTAKVSVVLFDLLFIVFSAANTTLAFESIVRFDNSCVQNEDLYKMKWKQEYLASTLLVALIAWLMTFSVSVLRIVERVER